jgi:hypothetical protein
MATEEGRASISQAWCFLNGKHHAGSTTDEKHVDIPKLPLLKKVIRQMDPDGLFPRFGEDDVPWGFEGGPLPARMTDWIYFAVFGQTLNFSTNACNCHFITTCTVKMLILSYC